MVKKIIESLKQNNKNKNLPLSTMYLRFDTYRASVWDTSPYELMSVFPVQEYDLYVGEGFANFQSYTNGIFITDNAGTQVGRILWGPTLASVFIEAKGLITDEVVIRLRERFDHQVTRADIRLDWFEPGKFKPLLKCLMAVKKTNPQIRSQMFGDWNDHPEDGRSFYLGSAKSMCQVVLYEKGKQRENRYLGMEDWVRLEWRVRPETKHQKVLLAGLDPHEIICMSPMGRKIAELVLSDYDPSFIPDLPKKPKSSLRKSFEHMLAQYTPTMRQLAVKEGSSIEQVLAEIGLTLTGKPWVTQEIDVEVAV
jgi:hypothetical protein